MCWGKMALKIQRKQFKSSSKLFNFFLLGLLVCCLKDSTASRPGCNDALGMQNGKIKDWQLSAYSKDFGYGPTKGRLNGNGAWCSKNEKAWTEYFQIVLDKVRHVSGLGTQGHSAFFVGSYWVKTYAVRYSYDGWTWYWYKDQPLASKKEFDANTDGTTVKRITFRETFVTKYLRIYPITYTNDMCLRVEIYGCPSDKDACTQTLNQPTGVFTSPNYPSPYPRGVDCTWIITLPDKSKQVGLFFKHFDVNDGSSWSCFGGDYVDVLDGPTDISSSIGQYCNGDVMSVVKTTGSTLRVHFHSESDSHPRKGFEAQFVSFTKGVDDILLGKACRGSTLRLNCSSAPSKSIKILYASYGTTPYSSHCGNVPTNTTCQASGALNTVTSLCKHYKSCNIDVSSRQFGLPCGAGVVPRLTVYYQCTGTVIKTLPPTPSTTTSSPSATSPPSTTNTTPSPITDSITTTTHQMTSIPPTDPGSPPSTAASKTGEVWSPTPTSSGSAGGNKLARMKEDDNVGMVVGIVVAVILVVLILVIVLLCFLYRRRQRRKDNSMPGVTYTATPVVSDQAPTRNGSSGGRANAYESVNVLYVSADQPCGKKDSYEHIYDSPDLQEPLPKMTNNPLYHGASSGFDDNFDEYESIDPPTERPPLPPRSLAPSIYESPSQGRDSQSSKKSSISNPSYDKTVIEIPESEK